MLGKGVIEGFLLIAGFAEGDAVFGILGNSWWSAGYIQPIRAAIGIAVKMLDETKYPGKRVRN